MRPLGCPTFVESIETCSFRDQIALGDGEPVAPVAGLAMFSLTFLMCSQNCTVYSKNQFLGPLFSGWFEFGNVRLHVRC